MTKHLSRCLIAGVVALLPLGGFLLGVVYLESMLADSWLAKQPFYIPGLGLLLLAAVVYIVGLVVSTFAGRWLWNRADSLLDRLPALGQIYQTLKQILGYGEGKEGMFQRVVALPSHVDGATELGLVTGASRDENGEQILLVFLPGAPNPTTGKLVFVPQERARPVGISVNEALKALVSVGKSLDRG